MKPTDIAPMDKWVELETEIHRQTGLDVNVFDTEGYRVTDVKNWANRLCPEIKATDKGQSFICAPAHMNIAMQAMREKQAVIEECDAGLVKIVIPIFFIETFVGAVGCCGVVLGEGEIEPFLIHKITGIEEEKIESLSEDINRLTVEKAEALVALIEEKINRIVGDAEKG
jgi:ligand-binding sensor protein